MCMVGDEIDECALDSLRKHCEYITRVMHEEPHFVVDFDIDTVM